MFNLGPMELLVIVVIALVVLGPQRLPDAMKQVGKGLGEAKRWSTQLTNEVQSAFVAEADAPRPVYPAYPAAAAAAGHVDAVTSHREAPATTTDMAAEGSA